MMDSEILNLLLGGGLAGTIAVLVTMKANARKAGAEAEKASAEAETVSLSNSEAATKILMENIVTPLREELNATRKTLRANTREVYRLRRAIDTAGNCRHRDDCPVLGSLHVQPDDGNEDGGTADGLANHKRGKGGRIYRNPVGTA